MDRSFLDLEGPTTHMHVAAVFVFEGSSLVDSEGELDVDAIRGYVASRLHAVPRYRQRIAWIPLERHPVWVDDPDFDIRHHVRHVRLPPPGDDDQLKEACSEILARPLDRRRPLWEIRVVSGLEHDRGALVCKVHHCMTDGVGGMELVRALFSVAPTKEYEEAPPWRPRPHPNGLQLLSEAAWRRIDLSLGLASALLERARRPEQALRELCDSALGVAEIAAVGLRSASPTPFNRKIGPRRRFDGIAFDLDEVKRVKNRLGGTVNDVVLAVVAGAVGRILELEGLSRRALRELEFRAYCPVNVRADESASSLGNRVSAMIAPLPIAERNPRERMRKVKSTTRRLKSSRQALGADVVAGFSDWLLPVLQTGLTRFAFSNRSSNLIVSNIPGPPIPLFLLSAPLVEFFPVVPLFQNQVLGIALSSYAGGLYWGLIAAHGRFPAREHFPTALDPSFHELCEAAVGAA
jgi:WS/DGAT/MGAT family acyltransferase